MRSGGAWAVGTLGLLAVACGGGGHARSATVPARPIGSIPASALPASVDGLRVQAEKLTSSLTHAGPTYAQQVGFFSLRQGKLVEATLEVIRLSSSTPSTSGFRVSLANQISGGVPTEVVLSGHDVYQATGLGSGTSTWFDGRTMYILTVRSQFAAPRSLLESALGLNVS